jgi:uncharacterized protein (TIGR03435 family)
MNIAIGFACLFLFATNAVHGQAAAKLEFEVASVKPMPPSPTYIPETKSGGPGTTDPGLIAWSGVSLRDLIETAYHVKSYQIIGPAWLGYCSDRYTIVVKVPEGATKEQVNLMWQNLLEDRFGMVVHHESRVFQAEEMTLAKGASKLKETDLPDSAPQLTPGMGLRIGTDGSPQLSAPGLTVVGDGPARRILGRAQSLAQVASFLTMVAGHPVTDKTGLTGKYDFSAELDLSQPCANCVIASALEEELGLRLAKGTVRLDAIVVDHAEKIPTGN